MSTEFAVRKLFIEGDGQTVRTVSAERNDPGECAVHIQGLGDEPAVSFYLSAVDAALLAGELINAARKATGEEE
ncbi:MAG TPA: hypothetical protein VFX35_01300 [Solirubrobacterales bacterium]|nr:hypothetical protein [Solirubrobacterales bacterium]